MGLSRSCEHGAPDRALRIESFLLAREQFDRDMNEAIVQKPNYKAGFAGHGGMGSIPRKPITKNRVFCIAWATANDIARVKIAHNERNSPRAKPFSDLIGQKQPDVTQLEVS